GSIGPAGTEAVQNQILIGRRQPSLIATEFTHLDAFQGKKRPSVNIAEKSPALLQKVKVLLAHQIEAGLVEVIGSKRVLTLSPVRKAWRVKQLELAREFSIVNSLAATTGVCLTSVVARAEKGPEIFEASARTMDFPVCCGEKPCIPDKPLFL